MLKAMIPAALLCRRGPATIWLLAIKGLFLILMIALQVGRIIETNKRERIRASGELCVTYQDTEIIEHHKPTTVYFPLTGQSVTYCPDEDYRVAGERGMMR